MTLQNLFSPEISTRICLTLMHSLWQVAAAALAAGVIVRFVKKASVEWSYLIHFVALVVSLLAVPATFVLLSPHSPKGSESTEVLARDVEIHANHAAPTAETEPSPAMQDDRPQIAQI